MKKIFLIVTTILVLIGIGGFLYFRYAVYLPALYGSAANREITSRAVPYNPNAPIIYSPSVPIYEGYAYDNTTVYFRKYKNPYYELTPIVEADVHSFVELNNTYGKDTNAVFCNGIVLPQADAATFKVLEDGYGGARSLFARDAHRVYYKNRVYSDIDPDIFERASLVQRFDMMKKVEAD